jgi:hypothetical protein
MGKTHDLDFVPHTRIGQIFHPRSADSHATRWRWNFETPQVPAHDGGRFYQVGVPTPPQPPARDGGREATIGRSQGRPSWDALVDGKLLSKDKVLEDQVSPRPAQNL